jgi:alpha/beta superfamily hydrolase
MKQNLFLFFIFFTLLSYWGCEKDSDPDLEVNIINPSEVLETGFTLNWEINSTEYDSLIIEVSYKFDFSELVVREVISEKAAYSQAINGLKGKTSYYCRIIAWSHNKSYTSDTMDVMTDCTSEGVRFMTSDNFELAGTVYYLDNGRPKKPGIIFMHEFAYKSGNPEYFYVANGWVSTRAMNELIASDYVCMFFYFRGHGDSQDFDILKLPDDPKYLNSDLKAALSFLQNHERVYADSIALIGASIGSRVAVMGNCLDGVITSVPVSYSHGWAYDYNCPGTKPGNILIIAGENEQVPTLGSIDWAAEALAFYNECNEPKKLYIEPEATEHGTNLLNYPQVNTEIIDWIKTHL